MSTAVGTTSQRPSGTRPDAAATPAQQRRPDGGRWVPETREAVGLIFGPLGEREFAVRYWDSGVADQPAAVARFTLVLADPSALRRTFLPPSQLRVAEAYLQGDILVEGDLEAAARVMERIRGRLTRPGTILAVARSLLRLPSRPRESRVGTAARRLGVSRLFRRHSQRRDAAAVRSHYDVGNDFYQLWLDRRMVYSCGYFPAGTETIDQAQEAKLEHLCRKLRLRAGEQLLDIGCGWGGLVRYAAQHYGVSALGITLSRAQAALARQRVEDDGLAGRVRIEVRDYRTLGGEAPFDKIVSVGMCEHVGRSRLDEYFEVAWRALRPGGLFLNHCITRGFRNRQGRGLSRLVWRDGGFTNRYVFPDGDLPELTWLTESAARAGFETRDVESLREHYAQTLRHWVGRLTEHRSEAIASVGLPTYRVWRLYMAASAAGFASGRLNLHQALLAKPHPDGQSEIPASRADLYW